MQALQPIQAKSKIQRSAHKCLRDYVFADDAAVTAQSVNDLQQLMDKFSHACKHFGLTISLKKTQVLVQNADLYT